MKISPVGAEPFLADRRTDKKTDMTKLIVAFRNFADAPKIPPTKLSSYFWPAVPQGSTILTYVAIPRTSLVLELIDSFQCLALRDVWGLAVGIQSVGRRTLPLQESSLDRICMCQYKPTSIIQKVSTLQL